MYFFLVPYHKLEREKFTNISHDMHEEVDKGHGRIEQRKTHHIEINDWVILANKWRDAVRSHWGVENNLHWQLDVTFKEDECRLASGAVAMAVIKRFCMNLLKVNDTSKRRLKHRVMASAIDDDYRAKILLSA